MAWQPGLTDLIVNSPILQIVEQSGCLVEGSDKAEILDELTPQDGDLVVTHQRVGGFSASQLDQPTSQPGRRQRSCSSG